MKNTDEIAHYAKKMQKMGARNVLVSMAANGALLVDETGRVHIIGTAKGKAVNSVGAGDSMVAGFLAGYLEKNDYSYALGICRVGYSITDETGKVVAEDTKDIDIKEDSLTKLWEFDGTIHSGSVYNVALWIEQDGKLLAQNGYHDVFYMPQHTPGHPTYMSHETGCRIYWA